MFRFHQIYFLFTVLLLAIEILIAVFISDNFVRPYGGDFLVVILLYCFIKTFVDFSDYKTGIGVLLFSFLVEAAQYFQLVHHLHLQNNYLAKTVIGSAFEWGDLLAYTLGIVLVLLLESVPRKRRMIV